MHCKIKLPAKCIDATSLEAALSRADPPHGPDVYDVTVYLPVHCKIMVDAAVRLLSLANQLHLSTRNVRLEFEEGEAGTMGYLNRMGFFEHLAPSIKVLPDRPIVSTAKLYGGSNVGLVEIARINKDERDRELPRRLRAALARSCATRTDVDELADAARTIFAELIDNVFAHSDTKLDGYAALQVYPRGGSLKVAVSDSGLGIMKTLRPALKVESPVLADLPDVDLLVEIFRQGLSRHGTDRGCGLRGSAAKAMKFKAPLDVRLPTSRVVLTPATGAYTTAHCYTDIPLLWGTHICFDFQLSG